jgi:hypothetical protein
VKKDGKPLAVVEHWELVEKDAEQRTEQDGEYGAWNP